jgi:hypothetical protein
MRILRIFYKEAKRTGKKEENFLPSWLPNGYFFRPNKGPNLE